VQGQKKPRKEDEQEIAAIKAGDFAAAPGDNNRQHYRCRNTGPVRRDRHRMSIGITREDRPRGDSDDPEKKDEQYGNS
jgi:hypothetical protein